MIILLQMTRHGHVLCVLLINGDTTVRAAADHYLDANLLYDARDITPACLLYMASRWMEIGRNYPPFSTIYR